MVKSDIDKNVIDEIDEYIKVLQKHYKIDAVYLFGSYAKGVQRDYSDIDIAVVSRDIKDDIDDMANMFVLAKNFDLLIEPHPINTTAFRANKTPLIDEIKRTGVPLYVA